MRFGLIFFITALTTLWGGVSMLIPTATAYLMHESHAASVLLILSAVIVGIGGLFFFLLRKHQNPLRTKEMFLATTLIWIFFSFISALPFYFLIPNLSFTNALFEAVSGLTTTGATVLNHLEELPKSLLLWRSMTQWIGGIGIIFVVIMVLPALQIGGMQFFMLESSERSDRSAPKTAEIMHSILFFFLLLTLLCTGSLFLAGMNLFDAINHALTCIATGGFSTHDANIAYYQNIPAIEWILTFFMLLAGLPILFWPAVVKRQWNIVLDNEQIFTYLRFLIYSLLALTLWRLFAHEIQPAQLMDTIRNNAFHILSIVTTTGYVSDNYCDWGTFAILFFFFLYFTGACTGSTSGGIKMFRYTIVRKTLSIQFKQLIQPHGVFIARYGNQPISENVLISVLFFFTLFFAVATFSALILSAFGLDILTSLSAVLTALSNVGPGLGSLIGPDKTFFLLPDATKWVLMINMLLGRLEFVAILVLFFPFLWRKNV